MAVPTGSAPINVQTAPQETSRTYRLNTADNRIGGMVDGLEAVKQAVYKALLTGRFAHYIYSANYGTEQLTDVEISERIEESLLQDDRIQAVENFQATFAGDSATVSFTVRSVFGSFQAAQEVKA